MTKLVNIGLVVGEFSGDLIGAKLIKNIKKYLWNVNFVGIAGPLMQLEGMKTWFDINELMLFGITNVIPHLSKIRFIKYDILNKLLNANINVFIGIDSPEINIFLETKLKKCGIYTIHYISPSIWAWRKKRIKKLKHATNNVLITFPFEKKFYEYYNVNYKFVGHPVAENLPLYPNKILMRKKLNIDSNSLCLVMLPGSRKIEIDMISVSFLKCVLILKNIFPNLIIIVPLNNQDRINQFTKIKNSIAPNINIRIMNYPAYQIMVASDIALLTSGTATLECMIAKCPMVVGYRIPSLDFVIAKILIRIKWISLPNLLANKYVVNEYIQNNLKPELLASTIIKIILDKCYQRKIKNIFVDLHKKINFNASEQATKIVLQVISNNLH
ncbi:MAG: lipid-A-disaccharide synthase [Candidatus Lightella neohaematopini]|nr:lipid-A-disaccharide synthase [Candidatus Lightella neohaematopini]